MYSLPEKQTEYIINNILINKNWNISDDGNKNVFFQSPPSIFEEQKKKLKRKRPDYILYQTGTQKPIAIIEAKKGGTNLKDALDQGSEYAKALDCPIVFAMNGSYCETRFIPNGKELILNKHEVRELITEEECLKFIAKNTNEVCTIPEEILIGRDQLISVFKNLNDVLRGEGLRAGMERFSEFANILFLKLISENGRKSWWSSIKKQDNDDLISYINNIVFGEIKNEYGGEVFLPLQIENPKNLRSVIDKLDPLILSTIDFDVKGEAFEHFLEQTTSTENDLGEYFTPRHIVKTIVKLADPKFGETIYDPFCGTGGFLTESYKHIKDNTIIKTDSQTEILKKETIFGREITLNARIAKMNMILQGDGHSGIEKIDSLANPEMKYKVKIINDQGKEIEVEKVRKFDIVITNMPFSQKTTESSKYENGLAKNNGDAVCVLHCLQALKQGGRMALVVPEGFLFRKDVAKVREFLLSKCKLQSVISLPQGAFLPYTGVKTDILYFTDAHLPNNQKDYWYFDAKNVGYTLDNKRRKIKGKNDLNKILESDFKRVEKNIDLRDSMLEIGFEIVEIAKIKANYYNLVGAAYRISQQSGSYKMISLASVLDTIETGSRPKGGITGENKGAVSLGGEQIGLDGKLELSKLPIVSIEFYNNAKKGFVTNNDILICKDGALTGKVCIVNAKTLPQNEVMTNEHVYILRGNKDIVNQLYLFYCIYSQQVQHQIKNLAYNKSAQPGLNRDHIEAIQIPLPTLDEQQKIVDQLNTIQKSIDNANELIKNLKIEGGSFLLYGNENEFESVRLGDIVDFIRGISYKSENLIESGGIAMYTLKSINKDVYSLKDDMRYVNIEINDKKIVTKNDIIVAVTDLTPTCEIIGLPKIIENENRSTFSMDTAKLIVKNKNVISKYIYYILQTDNARNIAKNCSNGTNVKHLDIESFGNNFKVLLPSIEIQQKIIQKLDSQFEYIKQTQLFIESQKEKIDLIVKRLWQSF